MSATPFRQTSVRANGSPRIPHPPARPARPLPPRRPARLLSLLALAAASLAGACGTGGETPGGGMEEAVITRLDTVVSLESEILASPGDIQLDAAGNLYIVDRTDSRIVRLTPDDGEPDFIGAQGSGPGEFEAPEAVAVAGDSLRVLERGNGRVQVLTPDGGHVRSYPLPIAGLGGVDIAEDGRVVAATMGFRTDILAVVFDPEGQPVDSLGTTVAPPQTMWDMTAIQNAIAAGEVPAALRNWTRPVLDPNGGTWLILVAEGTLERYDDAGVLLWSRPMEAPELAVIREHFFQRNAELKGQAAFYPLNYVSDAVPVEKGLWMLLHTPEGVPGTVLVYNADGRLRRRFVFQGLEGASQLAVDTARRRLYLALPAQAAVLAAAIP